MAERQRFRFGALGEMFDGPHATPVRRADGPYFLNIASLKSGRLALSESDHVSTEDFVKWTRRVTPRAQDLLFSYETRLGEAALMPHGVQACLGRRMALLRPNQKIIDPRFLLYMYLGPEFQQTIAKNTVHGATVPRISLSTMPEWEVEIPARREQFAIAEVLGALDDKIVANDRIARLSFDLARVGFDREVGDAADRVAIGDLARRGWLYFGDGYRTKRGEHGRPGFRILRAGDVKNNSISPEGADFVSNQFRRAIGAKASQPGDVVLTTKGTVGRVAVIPNGIEQVVYSPQICYFRVAADGDNLNRGFLAAWFRSSDLQHQTQMRMHKSDMAPYINLKDIQSLEVPAVDAMNQERIGAAQSAFERQSHAAIRENRALAHLRDELLPLLMSGKIRVRDAERQAEDVL